MNNPGKVVVSGVLPTPVAARYSPTTRSPLCRRTICSDKLTSIQRSVGYMPTGVPASGSRVSVAAGLESRGDLVGADVHIELDSNKNTISPQSGHPFVTSAPILSG
jgi:hypothetical protein